MTAARSMIVFAVYMLALGGTLLLAPNFLLALFGFAPTEEVWIRVIGVLVLILSFYYFSAARSGATEFMRWTVPGRASIMIFFIVFVVAGLAPPMLLLFGAVDLAGSGLTWYGLRKDASLGPA